MPMDFPDIQSLLNAAKVWNFRAPNTGETEAQYRTALADHVQSKDLIESMEIRTSKGWNRFSSNENRDMISRARSQR